MAVEIKLPELGVGDRRVRVSTWFVDVGDEVEAGDRVVEVMVSGMTFDVSASAGGYLIAVEKDLHAVVVPGDVLGVLDTNLDAKHKV